MLKNPIFFVLLIARIFLVHAEGEKVSAQIIDAETGEPLPFTTIQVEGMSRGTVANIEGRFLLDINGLPDDAKILVSHIGYEVRSFSVKELSEMETIKMKVSPLNLQTVQVYSKTLTAEEIIELIVENYKENYPSPTQKQQIFFHKFEKTPFGDENQIKLKKSNFPGMDKNTIKEIFDKLPDQFVEYQDAIVELYQNGDKKKLTAQKAISLEEGSMKDLSKEMEEKFGAFIEDLEQSKNEEDVYFKFRSGIFAAKMDTNEDSDEEDQDESLFGDDSLHYNVPTGFVKGELSRLIKDYSTLEGENWEFLTKTSKYRYDLEKVTLFNEEVVYKINFIPKPRGLYQGTMFVSTQSYAILQLDFEFGEGKSDQNFQLLGVGHSMKYKRGRVIFEKDNDGYFLKYIYARQKEYASIERNFSIMKKQKRLLFDKELNEIKLSVDLQFDMDSNYEILVQKREKISKSEFENIKERSKVKYKIEYSNSPDIWKNQTVLAPTNELTKFQRTE